MGLKVDQNEINKHFWDCVGWMKIYKNTCFILVQCTRFYLLHCDFFNLKAWHFWHPNYWDLLSFGFTVRNRASNWSNFQSFSQDEDENRSKFSEPKMRYFQYVFNPSQYLERMCMYWFWQRRANSQIKSMSFWHSSMEKLSKMMNWN